jgi:hypothetical protein
LPTELHAAPPERTDIEAAVAQHPEIEPTARRERKRPDSPLLPVVEDDAANRGVLPDITEQAARRKLHDHVQPS